MTKNYYNMQYAQVYAGNWPDFILENIKNEIIL